ncbi:Asp/Glu racemase [Curvibacter sp. CHRR-16]|uniref:aspartate/glutamate racemase family protein n=1 Tax=Curvibacter sp. CHRR-16 TaxID=2835872 RepID=UPI001BDB3408|nr:aspartate/glutamate racemase family protein [Curvibacter sp. CHRR-16]MBT0571803.1 Asp/Glu racemase [Curvibacter sp. CHRR-16]
MPHLLLINPNTSTTVSERLWEHTRMLYPAASQSWQVHTARLGAPYIACEASYAVAGLAVLDAWAHAMQAPPPDAVLIACFGDPGLLALRQLCPVPVTGLAEAAFEQACEMGPFAVVTGGAAWKPMLERLAYSLGMADMLHSIETVDMTGAHMLQNPSQAITQLTTVCQRIARDASVRSIIIGGAGLAGFAQRMQASVHVPLIDSVSAGLAYALGLAQDAEGNSEHIAAAMPAWQGLSPALQDLAGRSISTWGMPSSQ